MAQSAVGQPQELSFMYFREGGYHHCQIDNVSIGVAYIWDWLETVLLPRG